MPEVRRSNPRSQVGVARRPPTRMSVQKQGSWYNLLPANAVRAILTDLDLRRVSLRPVLNQGMDLVHLFRSHHQSISLLCQFCKPSAPYSRIRVDTPQLQQHPVLEHRLRSLVHQLKQLRYRVGQARLGPKLVPIKPINLQGSLLDQSCECRL